MERGFLFRFLLYQLRDAIQGQLVGDAESHAPIVRNLIIEFGTLVAHGSPPVLGREPAELSVTDSCRAPSGDAIR